MIIVISIIAYLCIGVMIEAFIPETNIHVEASSMFFGMLFWPVYVITFVLIAVTTPAYVVARFIKHLYTYRKSSGRGECKYCKNVIADSYNMCRLCIDTGIYIRIPVVNKSWLRMFIEENIKAYWRLFK